MAHHHNRRNDSDDSDHQPRARFNRQTYLAQQAASQGTVSESVQENHAVVQLHDEHQERPRQPRHEVSRSNTPRDKKFHSEMIPLREFEQMLRDALWVINVDPHTGSFHQIAVAQKAQTDLYYTAYRNGAKHMEAWFRHQVNLMKEKIAKAHNDAVREELAA
jgi:hypothetical protein